MKGIRALSGNFKGLTRKELHNGEEKLINIIDSYYFVIGDSNSLVLFKYKRNV